VREILWYGRERGRLLPPELGRMAHGEVLSRTYRVIANGQPMMIINEKFPVEQDGLPDHH
jgi:chorismate-pyruvate lyase